MEIFFYLRFTSRRAIPLILAELIISMVWYGETQMVLHDLSRHTLWQSDLYKYHMKLCADGPKSIKISGPGQVFRT